MKEHSTSPQALFVSELEIIGNYHKALDRFMFEAQSLESLKNCLPVVLFLKNFYKSELDKLDQAEGVHVKAMPSGRGHYDQLQVVRAKTIDQIARQIFIHPLDFVTNVTNKFLEKEPPGTLKHGLDLLHAQEMTNPSMYQEIESMLLRFAAVEISVQPYIRSKVKQMYYSNGQLITRPTEEGKKTLDVVHNNYRVKRLNVKLATLRDDRT